MSNLCPLMSPVSVQEAEPLERVGYIYFSDHATGSYLGWPAVDWCPESNYDPRLRPWYLE